VPAAIHCTPEALGGGPLAYLQDGDNIRLCAETGTLSSTADFAGRKPVEMSEHQYVTGRELFAMFRTGADSAEHGASAMLAAAGL
jgi:phosphogluconate dehydratase